MVHQKLKALLFLDNATSFSQLKLKNVQFQCKVSIVSSQYNIETSAYGSGHHTGRKNEIRNYFVFQTF